MSICKVCNVLYIGIKKFLVSLLLSSSHNTVLHITIPYVGEGGDGRKQMARLQTPEKEFLKSVKQNCQENFTKISTVKTTCRQKRVN